MNRSSDGCGTKARTWIATALLGGAFGCGASYAQDGWEYRIAPYVWVPSLYADMAVGSDPPASSETSLLDVLDFAFMVTGEARKGDWGVIGEFNYLSLSQDATWAGGAFGAEMSLEGVMAGAAAAYRFARADRSAADVFAGARAWRIDAEIDFDALPAASKSRSWVDPILGVRGHYEFSDKIFADGLAEIGGFGVGSDLQWGLVGRVGYRFGDTVSAALGYRHLAIDFDDASLVLDAEITGPFVAVEFDF